MPAAHKPGAIGPSFHRRRSRDDASRLSMDSGAHDFPTCACESCRRPLSWPKTEPNLDVETFLTATSERISATQHGGGCEIRTREGLPPTRFPTLRACVHHRPRPSVTCTNAVTAAASERHWTQANEPRTEPQRGRKPSARALATLASLPRWRCAPPLSVIFRGKVPAAIRGGRGRCRISLHSFGRRWIGHALAVIYVCCAKDPSCVSRRRRWP